MRLYAYTASVWYLPPVLASAHDHSTSELSPVAAAGTHETVICSLSFSKALPPWMTFTASVTAVMLNAQHVPNGCCCCTGPTAPCSRQSMATAPSAARSSSAVKERAPSSVESDEGAR